MNTYPRARVLALAGMLCLYGTGTAQSVFTGYKELLPDTLLPGKMYELHRVMGILAKTSALPSSYPDTVDLKRGASVIRMVGWMGTDGGGITYQVNIPLDAAIGVYNAYSPKGVLLESVVAEVPDVKSIVPRILGGAPRGFRGQTRNFHLESMGLAFGPLQSSGTFTPALRYAALEKGQDTLRLEQIAGTAPYNIGSVIKVPSAASVGLYRLVLERNDGLRTVKDSGFEVWIPEKPVITKVDPDSLIQGEFGMLGITGANLEYSVRQGSYVNLDRNVVKEVFLRKGELILPSNHAAQVYSLPPGASMSIPFDAPLNLPLGGYDLGIVLNGRTDTSYLAEAVRVLPAKPPRYLNFYPDAAVRSAFIATTASLNIQEGFQLASYTLRRGGSILKGKLLTFNGQVQEVRFEPPSDADTGMYSLQVDFPSGQVYRLENVFRLLGMSLSVNPRILSQGGDEVLGLSARGADFEFQVPAREGESGLIENARSISLCRNGSCLEGVPGRHFFQAWEVRFKVPEAQPVGVYELRLRTFEPDSVYVNPAAAVIGPKGYRIWNGYAAGDHAPYWSLHADSVGRLLDNIVGN